MEAVYNDHIGIYKDIVDPRWCDALISYFNENDSLLIDRNRDDSFLPKHVKDQAIFLKDINLIEYFLKVLQETVYPHYFTKNPYIPVEGWEIQDFKLQKTLPTEGYHIWHSEWEPLSRLSERYLVYSLYLNDVEEGGETEFLYQSLRVPPTKGTLVVFPSFYTHVHRGNPPLSGPKYIMTGWFLARKNPPQ